VLLSLVRLQLLLVELVLVLVPWLARQQALRLGFADCNLPPERNKTGLRPPRPRQRPPRRPPLVKRGGTDCRTSQLGQSGRQRRE
jgi:hypothetical protein